MDPKRQESLRMAVRFFYDLQKLRMQTSNRARSETADLKDGDQTFLGSTADVLHGLEDDALREVKRWLKGVSIYEQWLVHQKGCGPTMGGVLVSEVSMCRRIDPVHLKGAVCGESFVVEGFTYFRVQFTETFERRDGKKQEVERDLLCFQKGVGENLEVWEDCCPTASSLWAYCGLAVDTSTGKAVRRTKGQKSNWNPFVKTKVVGVLADCLIKADGAGRARAMAAGIAREKGEAYLGSAQYAKDMLQLGVELKEKKGGGYPAVVEHKKALIEARGYRWEDLWERDPWVPFYEDYKHRKQTMRVPVCAGCEKEKSAAKKKQCKNCGGTGGPAPWGASDGHRHNAAKRYMVKMFLLGLYKKWRELEGLPVREPYSEEFGGKTHHTGPASLSAPMQ